MIGEESKGSTSEEEPEYESDSISDKSIKSVDGAPRLKISYYLSSELITEANLTLADITIESYPDSKIETMEYELLVSVAEVRIEPLLIDPRAVMKIQKLAGNTETLVDYERIGKLANWAKTLYSNYLIE
jgi:hypothetical protein